MPHIYHAPHLTHLTINIDMGAQICKSKADHPYLKGNFVLSQMCFLFVIQNDSKNCCNSGSNLDNTCVVDMADCQCEEQSREKKKSPLPLKFVAFQITNPLRVCIFAPIINNTYLCSTYFAYKLAFLFCGWVVMGETNQNCTTRLVICLMPKCLVPALVYFQPHQLKSLFLRSVRTLISQYRI